MSHGKIVGKFVFNGEPVHTVSFDVEAASGKEACGSLADLIGNTKDESNRFLTQKINEEKSAANPDGTKSPVQKKVKPSNDDDE